MSEEAIEPQEPEIPEELQQYVEEPAEEPSETPVEEPKDEPEPQADPIVEKARNAGWKPQEEFEGDPDQWVDAGEFIRRQPLIDQIRAERKRVKDLEKKLDGTTKFVQGIEERVRKKTLEEIEAKRRQAVEDGDVEAFQQADKEFQEAQKAPEPEEEPQDELPQEVQDFVSRNGSWFEKNAAMTNDSVSFTEFYRNQGKPLSEALELAEKDIKRKYADFFRNPNKDRPSPVSPSTREQRPARIGYNDLTSEQKAVFSAMKGTMTLDQYISELKEQGAFDA